MLWTPSSITWAVKRMPSWYRIWWRRVGSGYQRASAEIGGAARLTRPGTW